jgi:signal peptidase I
MSNSSKKSSSLSSKEPWLATNLSFLLLGLGQFYTKNFIKGALFLFASIVFIPLGFYLYLFTQASIIAPITCLLLIVLITIVCLFDAYYSAKKVNKNVFNQERAKQKDPWLAVFISLIMPGAGHIYINKIFLGLFLIILSQILSVFNFIISPFVVYHVYTNAPVRREKNRKAILWFCFGVFLSFSTFAAGAFLTRMFVVEARYIPASSMEPTLKISDRVIINKLNYNFEAPKRGDIIVFNPTEALKAKNFKDAFIKRIIGIPNDTVEVKDGKVYINEKLLEENYIAEPPDYEFGPVKVPPNSYLVFGDNRNNSYDSHYWGFVPKDLIIGKATKIYWPLKRAREIK